MPPLGGFLSLSLLPIFLACAVWTDLRIHRISNRLVVVTLLSALVLQSAFAGFSGTLDACGGALVGLLGLMPFYVLKGMGAADVKWMAAVGAFFDPSTAALAVGMTLICGSVMAIGLLWLERVWPIGWLALVGGQGGGRMKGRRFPYAPAIAAGALTALYLISSG